MRLRLIATASSSAALVVLFGVALMRAQDRSQASDRWVTAWGASQQTLGTTKISNATVRMIARVSAPGDSVRIRLDNAFGTAPLVIGKVYVGQRVQASTLVKGSNQPATFNGAAGVTIAAGGTATSDPVAMKVAAWQDLAISLYVPGADVTPSQHSGAAVTSYLTPNDSGDAAADESRTPYTLTTTSMFWVKAIDVRPSTPTTGIVAFGDSITDGTCSTLDAHDRWEDWLSVRLQLDAASRGRGVPKAIVNEGIGGNTVTRERLQPPPDSPPGLERLDRDVLSHHGVTEVIVFMGTNDVRRGASAAQVIAGLQEIAKRVKARGLKVFGVTMIPRHNVAPTPNNTGWDDSKTAIRNEINQWTRTKGAFDAVIDFDKVVRDPSNADLIYPPFNCGDGIHPSPLGYYEMGRSVSLDLFKAPNGRSATRP